MRFDSRNLLIAVMFLFIIALMVLVYKVNKTVIARIPKEISPEVYVMGLTEAIERKNQAHDSLSYTTGWLKRHLDRCLILIESERGLEPIPIECPKVRGPRHAEGSFKKKSGPFVIPYERPQIDPERSSQEKDLRYLQCLVNMQAMGTVSSMYNADGEIANFQQRLERITPDPNNP